MIHKTTEQENRTKYDVVDTIMELNTQLCWLGNLVSEEQLNELARGIKQDRSHNRFLYPYTKQGEIGFFPLETVEQQAFCQHLAHLGCIPSMLLVGYSMSLDYIGTPRVICPLASAEYLFAGITAFLIHHRDPGFEREFSYFWGNYWFHEICRHVLDWFLVNAPDDYTHPVREFCEWWVANTGGPRLDS